MADNKDNLAELCSDKPESNPQPPIHRRTCYRLTYWGTQIRKGKLWADI